MSKIRERKCSVKWGGDGEYTEPLTLSSSCKSFTVVKSASEVLEERSTLDREFMDICKYVMYFSPV